MSGIYYCLSVATISGNNAAMTQMLNDKIKVYVGMWEASLNNNIETTSGSFWLNVSAIDLIYCTLFAYKYHDGNANYKNYFMRLLYSS